ncbi:ATP-binding protein [Saccharopolyspora phatthalungensis]|uniref:Putative ATPase/DNA-binding CsgD family transcriptional regulator n=1 Tax=Saccharopolyspora phatthalungensis TaxID=664693 RepID=A0A840Q3D9_9PSEU|nr:LuxR C-terminal-related transcriptional regulator [Saccharopolyspora phatthalungensis]MBB5152885.1 putative ATPase/DNA-binding CsgD family transcriptional regulator [Saccharopolyspora phatthalungensis]
MAAPRAVTGSVGSLPAELTSFVGRRVERAEIRRLLSRARLVTLTGFGGVGKTRLALRAATELRRAFPDGVWFADLSTLSDPVLVPDTVASALKLHPQSPRGAIGVLTEFLAPRHALLVLDSCEHLLDPCAELAGSVLQSAPNLRILATSRQSLNTAGEQILPVMPLPVPDKLHPRVAQIEDSSINLFLDRARAVVPDLRLTDDNMDKVLALCQQLEGVPLALELAAVQLRGMGLTEVLEQLSGRFPSLTWNRVAGDRQHSLRECIEWSYELCTPEERDLWAQAAVFAGGFELDAIESIATATSHDSEPALASVLFSLVDKSILIREEHDGKTRYRMLEIIRQYGQQRLRDSGQWITARRRHRDFYADFVDQAQAGWGKVRESEWFARLRREHANLQAALEFCATEPGEAVTGLRIAAGLRHHWMTRGLVREGRHWITRLRTQTSSDTHATILAINTAVWLATLQGDLTMAASLLEDGRALARKFGEPAEAFIRQASGFRALFADDLSRAASDFEKALATFETIGNSGEQVYTLFLLALVHTFAGDFERAPTRYHECLALDPPDEILIRAKCLSWLAILHTGDIQGALKMEQESLRLKYSIDDHFGIAISIDAMAWITARSNPRRAAALLGAAVTRFEEMGIPITSLPGLFTRHQECETRLRQTLADTFADAYTQGASLRRDTAIQYALTEEPHAQPAPDSARSPFDLLTPRESEVAALVSQGLSNKDIAKMLLISQRTAESHVQHILAKLSFASRAQIATWITERRSK